VLKKTKITNLNLQHNDLNDKAKKAIRKAVAGRDVKLEL